MLSELSAKENGVQPCIHGSETEFSIHAIDPSGDSVDTEDLFIDATNLSVATLRGNRCGDEDVIYEWGLTTNGGRQYLDYFHLEGATPECAGIHELILYTLAAERFALQALRGYCQYREINGFQINRRTGDHSGNFWGAHENTSHQDYHPRDCSNSDEAAKKLAVAHHLTRVLYTGEGGLSLAGDSIRYMVSPRVHHSEDDFQARTNHPLVGDADDLFDTYRRQVVGAANVSPWAIAVKHGMNGILLHIGEQTPDFGMNLLVGDVDLLTDKLAGNYEFPINDSVMDGAHVTAVDVQRAIAEHALENCALSGDLIWTAKEVIALCDDMVRDPNLAADRVDWLARRNYLEERGLSPKTLLLPGQNDLLERADFAWDTILAMGEQDGEKFTVVGDGVRKRDNHMYGWRNIEAPTEGEIRVAIVTPPKTRAADRIELIDRHLKEPGSSTVHAIDWGNVTFRDNRRNRFFIRPLGKPQGDSF